MSMSLCAVVLILWLLLGIFMAWSAYQSSIIARLQRELRDLKDLGKQKETNDEP